MISWLARVGEHAEGPEVDALVDELHRAVGHAEDRAAAGMEAVVEVPVLVGVVDLHRAGDGVAAGTPSTRVPISYGLSFVAQRAAARRRPQARPSPSADAAGVIRRPPHVFPTAAAHSPTRIVFTMPSVKFENLFESGNARSAP